jgi:hypothetical protein
LASANLVAYNAALKDTYTEDHLQEQIIQDDSLLSLIETTRRFHVGNEARTPLHTGRSGGYTAMGAGGGNLNAAGNQASKRATWQYTNHHFNIAIEGETVDGTGDDAIAVAQAVDAEVSGGLTDLRRQLVRQIATDGNAQIATMGVTSNSTTVVLEPVSGYNALERGWLFEGAVVDIGTAANPVLRANGVTILTISDPDVTNPPTFTVGSNITTAATDQISWKGSRTATPATFEMNGFGNIISKTTTVGNLAPATVSSWKAASVDTNGGTLRPLTLQLLAKANRKVKQATGGGADTIIAGYKQEEAWYLALQAQAQYAGDSGLDFGTVEKAKYRGMSVKGYDAIRNEDVFGFQKAHMFICAADKPYWQNKITGGEILAWIQGTDSYGAKCTYRIQLANRRRDSTFRIGDLA